MDGVEEKPPKTLETARAELIDSLRENKADDAKRLLQKFEALRSKKDDVSFFFQDSTTESLDNFLLIFCRECILGQ